MNQEIISDTGNPPAEDNSHRIFVTLTVIMQIALAVGFLIFLWRKDWENVVLTAIVMALIVIPGFILKTYRVNVPPDFQLVAVTFVILSMFLGSATDFYYKFWWWDILLHMSSGFLLGIVGWLVLFLLNETDRIPQGMRPGFLCFFAVTFASFLGVLWEILEYAVDRIAPAINMQSNETGVADTMNDLIVNTFGSIIVALMGWAYIKRGSYSFVISFVKRFIDRNPHLFRKGRGRDLFRRLSRPLRKRDRSPEG